MPKINLNEYKDLFKNSSNQNSFVFVYKNGCPACDATKPIISEMSLINLDKRKFNNIFFGKYNSDKNYGFNSTPKFIFIKRGNDKYFEMNQQLNSQSLKKNIYDFINNLSNIKFIKTNSLENIKIPEFKGEIDFSKIQKIIDLKMSKE